MRLYWAISTWMLFHVLIEKISDTFYLNKRYEIWKMLVLVCSELPCPICRSHAVQYLKNIDGSRLATRENFKRFMFDFHNDVNNRIGKPVIDYSQIDMYKNYTISTALTYFDKFYSKRYNGVLSIGLQSNMIERRVVLTKVVEWFRKYWGVLYHQ
jgi:hypothetical protein